MAGTVRVTGVKETTRALREVDGKLSRDFGKDLQAAADPVVADAKQLVTRYAGASVSTIRSRRAGPNVYVEQGARKVDGQHGWFGALQMRNVLVPALDQNTDGVLSGAEQVLDKYAGAAGLT